MINESKTFLATYNYGGKKCGFDFQAESYEDAQARLAVMSYGTVDGQLMATIPAGPSPKASGLAVRLICWARNTWASALRLSS